MEALLWAILLKPIILLVFMFTVVSPVAWLLFKLFPNGRLKVVLFKDRSGPEATTRDQVVMTLAAVSAYAAMIVAFIAFG